MWKAFGLNCSFKTPAFLSSALLWKLQVLRNVHRQSAIHVFAMSCRFKSKALTCPLATWASLPCKLRSDVEVMCKVLSLIEITCHCVEVELYSTWHVLTWAGVNAFSITYCQQRKCMGEMWSEIVPLFEVSQGVRVVGTFRNLRYIYKEPGKTAICTPFTSFYQQQLKCCI